VITRHRDVGHSSGRQSVKSLHCRCPLRVILAGGGHNGIGETDIRVNIVGKTSEDWTETANGTYIVFNTTPNGSTKIAEKARITDGGNVGIGTTAPANKLHISGTTGGIRVAGATADSVGISSTSGIRLYGNATVWDDLMFPFTTGNRGNNATPAFVPDSMYYLFTGGADTSNCLMYMTVQMPHRWADGVDSLYPHIHYKHTTTGGTPTFRVRYKWVNIGSAIPTAWTYTTLSLTTGTTDHTHRMSYALKNIPSTSKTISSLLLCQIYLVSQTGTGGIGAYQFDIHYPINSMGSNTSTSKD